MFKKTLISLAVASSLGLSGCLSSGDEGSNADPDYKIDNPKFSGKTWPVFNPVTGDVPIPSDLNLDQEAQDGSYGVDGDQSNPVIGALNQLSGASTVAPAVLQFSGQIDPDSVDSRAFVLADPNDPASVMPNPNQNVFLIELKYASGEPVRGLSISEPPTIPLAITVQVAGGADPLGTGKDLEGRNPAEAGGYLAKLGQTPAYDHDVVELDGTTAIRVRPNKPLDPLKRYIVAVTDSVKDVNGDSIVGSPSYQNVSTPDAALGDGALEAVQTLATKLWEPTTESYLGVNNSSRAAMDLPALTKDNIALSYSFTTSDDKKVLSYIGNPATWIADQVKRSVTVGAAQSALESGASDFAGVYTTVQTTLAGFEPSTALGDTDLALCDDEPYGQGGPYGEFDDQFECIGTFIEAGVNDALDSTPYSLPEPDKRAVSIEDPNDALETSAVLSSLDIDPGDVDVHQGSIALPQYLAVPDANQTGATSTIRTKSWQPDVPVAGIIGNILGSTIPQENPDVSTVLNYNFPFPEQQGEVEVPMLVITPEGMDPEVAGADLTPVIFQHGITTDRSAALAYGSQLVASAHGAGLNLAVFAIDQPLHGVAPFTKEEQEDLALTLLVEGDVLPEEAVDPEITEEAQGTVDAVIAKEFSTQTLSAIGLGLPPFDTACSEAQFNGLPDGSGGEISGVRTLEEAMGNVLSVSGNLTPECGELAATQLGLATSLEHTVANAGSTIPGLAPASQGTGFAEGEVNERHYGYTAGADTNPVKMNFEEGIGESGSLFINLTNFPNTRDILRQGSVDMMNLTATINNMEGIDQDSGVTFIGHSLGTLNGGAFVGAATASGNEDLLISAAHLLAPVAGTTRLLENSPSLAPTILGGLGEAGLAQGDADLETFLNVNQASLDSVDPINFANELAVSNTVVAQIKDDRTTPNAADTRYGDDKGPLDITFPNGLNVHSFEAPLTGSEALAAVMGAKDLTPGDAVPAEDELPAITRYTYGAHATPVLPQEVTAKPGEVLKDRTIAQGGETVTTSAQAVGTFGNMIEKTLELIGQTQQP